MRLPAVLLYCAPCLFLAAAAIAQQRIDSLPYGAQELLVRPEPLVAPELPRPRVRDRDSRDRLPARAITPEPGRLH
ncbi:hypothetical protein SAMN05216212_2559 [Microbulbifer yueqingensis]|uniref:Uncharacterized protein n=1 Tax=Microbulbifer yueqingensis TaxID=658219 RepID=A0A1G9CM46_9GAMM|nr:hypothetical protein SAMN05216212_2559 [Microbulbifer yueqingensis]